MKSSKRYQEVAGKVNRDVIYTVDEGIKILKQAATAKFDETLEISVILGVDPKYADQNVRGVVSLPHGTGKTKTVLVLTTGTKEKEAQDAGADYVGLDEYVEKIKGGWADVDAVIATPDVMRDVGKLGKILGPRGLMPSPKAGTVTMDITEAVSQIKAGRIEFRVDKKGILHSGIGKVSFDENKIKENILSYMSVVQKLRPSTSKGQYIKKISISSTMGPGIKLDSQDVIDNLK